MWMAIAVVVLVAAGACGYLLLRSRDTSAPRGEPAKATPPAEATKPAASAVSQAAPVRIATGTTRASAPPVSVNPADDLKMVCCQVGGAMHGAMPPFGKLHVTPTGLLFEATSRVISKAGDALDSSDGATTMQSLGSMEMGQYRFEIARSATQRVEFKGGKATLYVDGEVYMLEGLGPSGGVLGDWLRGNGFDS
jgi:hypothetical protein